MSGTIFQGGSHVDSGLVQVFGESVPDCFFVDFDQVQRKCNRSVICGVCLASPFVYWGDDGFFERWRDLTCVHALVP